MRFLAVALGVAGAVFSGAASSQTTSVGAEPAEATLSWNEGWQTDSIWRITVSPFTYHFSYSPDHRPVHMLGLERQRSDGLILGGAYFSNSFGQPSAYLYGGQRYDAFYDIDSLFAQVTAGLLYGYKPPFDKKVPLNYKGFSPGLVLSLGWQFTPRWSVQANLLGNSAVMFQVSADFP